MNIFGKFVIKVLVNCFEFTNNHNDLDKEVRSQFLEIANVFVVDFGPVEI
jgi:hypothetical protein